MFEVNNFILYVSIGICGLLTVGICFGMPIFEIYLGFTEIITCNTSMFVDLNDWLIIKGFTTLAIIICLFILSFMGKKSCLYYILMVICIFINIFLSIWLVIGSIIFWKDCINLEPKIVKDYMWFSLILGYITILNMTKIFE